VPPASPRTEGPLPPSPVTRVIGQTPETVPINRQLSIASVHRTENPSGS
jgi:hypothetical protein